MKRLPLVLWICGWFAAQAFAQSPVFLKAYELALTNDPAYRAALKEFEASQYNRDIGNAALRPVIAFTQTNSKNDSARTLQDSTGRTQHDNPQYISSSGSLALRQPLISYEATARQRIGDVQATYGQHVLDTKKQDLLLRLLKAWTELHFTQDQVRLAKSQLDAYAEQLKLNEATLKLGEGTKTDLLETRTKYELTMGQLLETTLELSNKQRALEAIIGAQSQLRESEMPKPKLAPEPTDKKFRGRSAVNYWAASDAMSSPITQVAAGVDIDRLEDGSLREADWLELALNNSPEIRALQQLVELGELEAQKAQSGHMPKLDLTLTRSHNRSDSLNSLNQQVQTTSLGLQLTVPIYSGGQITATTLQALATAEQQRAELEKKTQEITTDIRRQLNLVRLNRQKKQALTRAVAAAEELVLATRKSLKAGVKVNLDVLNALQQVFTLRRDLAQASYNLLNAWAGLRAAAGQINDEVVLQIAKTITH